MKETRRQFLKKAMIAGSLLVGGNVKPLINVTAESGRKTCGYTDTRLDRFKNNVRSGGQPPDGIPPIENPKYVSANNAEENLNGILTEDSIVFGMNYHGHTKAFPRSIMVWHEIVNDRIAGDNVSITYCPLTGSAIGYLGLIDGNKTTFGTTGKLLNSNLVMYDRQSGPQSYWPQILGTSITEPYKGERLEQFPLAWTTWGKWKKKHPATEVLTTDTGYNRSYGYDPYGSYKDGNSYYQTGGPFFSVMPYKETFSAKKVVTGIKVNNCALAIPKKEFKRAVIVNTELGDKPVVAIYNEVIDAVRVYERSLSGQNLELYSRNRKIYDRVTGTQWTESGTAISGKLAGKSLTPIKHFDVMWFGWSSFYPETEVLKI